MKISKEIYTRLIAELEENRAKNRALLRELEEQRRQYLLAEAERQKFRAWIADKFVWFVSCAAKNERPCIEFLIKATAKALGATL